MAVLTIIMRPALNLVSWQQHSRPFQRLAVTDIWSIDRMRSHTIIQGKYDQFAVTGYSFLRVCVCVCVTQYGLKEWVLVLIRWGSVSVRCGVFWWITVTWCIQALGVKGGAILCMSWRMYCMSQPLPHFSEWPKKTGASDGFSNAL